MAHRGDTHDLHRQIEVGHHPAHDRQLLVILLAEHRHVGLCCVQQLDHDGGDALEVTWPHRSFEPVGECAGHHPRVEPGRVHHGRGGRVDGVDAERPAHVEVAVDRTRIEVEVGGLVELQRVDEDRDDHDVGQSAGCVDQRRVPRVQGAHRRDHRQRHAARTTGAAEGQHRQGIVEHRRAHSAPKADGHTSR